jgi:MFS family permease
MSSARTRRYTRVLAAAGSAIAAVAASIVLPTAVITIQAVQVRDLHRIEDFALTVAEPLGVLGAGIATLLLGFWASRSWPDGRRLVPWIGGGAAAGLIGAAVSVLDADWWTVAGAILMPIAALAGGALGGRETPGRRPAELAEPPLEVGQTRREAESARRE